MSRFFLKKILLCLLVIVSFKLSAQSPPSFQKKFEAQQYQEAIDSLKEISESTMNPGNKDYLLGLCYSRLREYESATVHFKRAIKLENSNFDIHYEYGQALYAANNLRLARYEFSKSAGKNFNYTASVYYVAYISELLEDYVTAKYNYNKLIQDSRTDKKILQISYFQYAKILLKMMRREEQSIKTVERNLVRLEINLVNYIPRYILPLLKKAQELNPTTDLGPQIDQFARELTEEFKLDPNILSNGRRVSAEKLYASVAQRFNYDDNVNYSKKASAIYETEAFARYDFIINKRLIVAPELKLTYTLHKDQKTPEVYQNDALTFASALRNKIEHVYNDRPASFLFDMEYGQQKRDWRIQHQKELYYTNYSFGIGEQLSLFSSGETYFKFRQSHYTYENVTSSYKSLSLSADQYIFFKDGLQLLIATFDMTQLDYFENSISSYDTYLFRMLYLFFEVVPTYSLQLNLSTTVSDPKEQRELRGYEITLNPGIELSKTLTEKIRLSLNYNYTQYSSKQAVYRYHKQVAGVELSLAF